jgi:hypothetical protein
MGKYFHWVEKLLLFIMGRETGNLQRYFAFIGMWNNIFRNPGWWAKRLVNISQGHISCSKWGL